MKRCMILLLTGMIIGCKNTAATGFEKISGRPFVSEIEMEYNGGKYNGNIARDDSCSLKLSLKSPDFTAPVEYEITQNSCRISQGELDAVIRNEQMQPHSAMMEIYRSFFAVGDAKGQVKDGKIIFESGFARFEYDKTNDTLISLETEDGKINFINFSFSDKPK